MSSKLEIMLRNLRTLEKKKAMYGPGEAPLYLINQIEDLREQLHRETGGTFATTQPADPGQSGRVRHVGESLSPVQADESMAAAAKDVQSDGARPFVLQLLHPQGGQPQVQVQSSSAGETGLHPLNLPYSAETLAVVLNALSTPVGRLKADRFRPGEVEILSQLHLIESGYLLHTMYEIVGRDLYSALFSGPVEDRFQAARAMAGGQRHPLTLRLVFDRKASALAAFPWELVYGDVPLVADSVIDLTRYLAFPGPRSSLAAQLPLRVLVISPRPSSLPSLPDRAEPDAIAEGLQPLAERGALHIKQLVVPTREALVEHLRREEVHIIHFDGHGSFGRLCLTCHVLHIASAAHCIRCGYPLSTASAQGYLAFEDANGDANYVSARAFANALTRNKTQVVVLSACLSGQVGDGSAFNGVGPALIQVGIPAVVAMQLVIPVAQAIRFARALYASLADFRPLVGAVGRGRQQLYDGTSNPQAWFVPALYLRSDDPHGELFNLS